MKLPLCAAQRTKSRNIPTSGSDTGGATGTRVKGAEPAPFVCRLQPEAWSLDGAYTVTGCCVFFFTGTGVSQ